MEVQITVGKVQKPFPFQVCHGKTLVAKGEHPVSIAVKVHDQPVQNRRAAAQLRAPQIVDQQLAGVEAALGLHADDHHIAPVLRDPRVAEIVVVGIELKAELSFRVIDGNTALIAGPLLRYGQIVAAVEAGGEIAQLPLRAQGPPDAVLIQQIDGIPLYIAHSGQIFSDGQLRSRHPNGNVI